jgi:hypothetical protein
MDNLFSVLVGHLLLYCNILNQIDPIQFSLEDLLFWHYFEFLTGRQIKTEKRQQKAEFFENN